MQSIFENGFLKYIGRECLVLCIKASVSLLQQPRSQETRKSNHHCQKHLLAADIRPTANSDLQLTPLPQLQ
ncbi:hypothetical protein V6N13_122443 [Hibiscus sabdariffa]